MEIQPTTRRDFLKTASLLGICAAAGLPGLSASAQTAAPKAAATTLKTSLNAYSFNKMLNDNGKGRGAGVTLMQVVDFAAKCKFDGVDPTAYFFPGYPKRADDAFVDALKAKAADLGLGISGTGVRNNFTTSDKSIRDAGVAHVKEWVEVAARLGAPIIRVFADTQMKSETWQTAAKGFTRDQVQEWMADDIRQCADHGKLFGVRIGVQNHADFLQTGQEQLDLIKAVNSDWCGPIVDTGKYRSPDPYADMTLVAPHAVNWQIKLATDEKGQVATDLIKLLHIIRNSGYHGFIPMETLPRLGTDYDPYKVVPDFLKQLQDAIAKTA